MSVPSLADILSPSFPFQPSIWARQRQRGCSRTAPAKRLVHHRGINPRSTVRSQVEERRRHKASSGLEPLPSLLNESEEGVRGSEEVWIRGSSSPNVRTLWFLERYNFSLRGGD